LLIPLNAAADDNDFDRDGCDVSDSGGGNDDYVMMLMRMMIVQFNYLFVYVLNQEPKGKLEIKHEQAKETKQTHTHKQKTEQGDMNHLYNDKNSVSAITLTNMLGEEQLEAYVNSY
jgi:hypothetical protein